LLIRTKFGSVEKNDGSELANREYFSAREGIRHYGEPYTHVYARVDEIPYFVSLALPIFKDQKAIKKPAMFAGEKFLQFLFL